MPRLWDDEDDNEQGALDLNFERGDCAILALRLSEITGLPLVGLFDNRGDLHHVAVEVSRDEVLDIAGVNTKTDRAAESQAGRLGKWRRVTATGIARAGLPTWDNYSEEELDAVDDVAYQTASGAGLTP